MWFIELLKNTGIPLGLNILRVLGVSVFSLSMVYLLGRMLGIIKKDLTKNIVAFISMTFFSFFTSWTYFKDGNIVYESIIVIAISIVLYVLIGFKLYNRADDFQDKHFGDDERKKKK